MLRGKFEKLKEEVNSDLGIFAGDLMGILEETSGSNPESKEMLEDLLIMASKCAKMTSNDFWLKCESIVQDLDDRRQDLPMGILKQVHTRLLFILTRCTRLVQFYNECGHEESHHILGLHQLSDLGAYTESAKEFTYHHVNNSFKNTEVTALKSTKAHEGDQELDTVKRVDSCRTMSSWKKLPSPAEKSRKDHNALNFPSKDLSDHLELKDENLETTSKVRRATFESSLICRICEVEIPTVHVEQHSRICTIADRCDLKGLSVNERLERVAETLEGIIDSWTPKGADMAVDSRFSGDLLETVHEAEEFHGSLIPVVGPKALSSAGNLTPRSPLVTPRTNQIEVFMSGRKTISEHEDCQQVFLYILHIG